MNYMSGFFMIKDKILRVKLFFNYRYIYLSSFIDRNFEAIIYILISIACIFILMECTIEIFEFFMERFAHELFNGFCVSRDRFCNDEYFIIGDFIEVGFRYECTEEFEEDWYFDEIETVEYYTDQYTQGNPGEDFYEVNELSLFLYRLLYIGDIIITSEPISRLFFGYNQTFYKNFEIGWSYWVYLTCSGVSYLVPPTLPPFLPDFTLNPIYSDITLLGIDPMYFERNGLSKYFYTKRGKTCCIYIIIILYILILVWVYFLLGYVSFEVCLIFFFEFLLINDTPYYYLLKRKNDFLQTFDFCNAITWKRRGLYYIRTSPDLSIDLSYGKVFLTEVKGIPSYYPGLLDLTVSYYEKVGYFIMF